MIELGYASGSLSTSVVHTDDYIEIVDEDGVALPPQDGVRIHVPSLGQCGVSTIPMLDGF